MEVENLILLSTQALLRSNEVSLAKPQNQKSAQLTTKYRTLIHGCMVVSRKYTKLNWQNSTYFFSTNPCFLQETVEDVSGDI